MARQSKKSVYERIQDKKKEILEAEQLLATLNEELEVLKIEQDELEMRLLLETMKIKGLSINEALAKINDGSEPVKEITTLTRTRKKKDENEIVDNTEE